MSLQDAFDKQYDLQTRVYGHDLENMTLEDRVAFITINTMAATDEAHEALNETSWKPWAKGDWINEENFKKELVDEFHFFMNRCLVVGMNAEELLARYFAKAWVNEERQLAGYDGVTGKCTICRRAFDDVGESYTAGICDVCIRQPGIM